MVAPTGGAKKQYRSIQHVAYVAALGNSKLVTEMAKATTGPAGAVGEPSSAPDSARPAISTSPAPLTEEISLRSRPARKYMMHSTIQSGPSLRKNPQKRGQGASGDQKPTPTKSSTSFLSTLQTPEREDGRLCHVSVLLQTTNSRLKHGGPFGTFRLGTLQCRYVSGHTTAPSIVLVRQY